MRPSTASSLHCLGVSHQPFHDPAVLLIMITQHVLAKDSGSDMDRMSCNPGSRGNHCSSHSGGMAVTCDHRIRSLATINKKTGFGSLVTTKCGHLRPQKVTFADRANKTQKCMRSLATTICGHLRPKIGIAWQGGWGGWVGWMITYLALAHTLAEHITCIHGWVGWVGGVG